MNVFKSIAALGVTMMLVMGYVKIEAKIADASKAADLTNQEAQSSFTITTPVGINFTGNTESDVQSPNTGYPLIRFKVPDNIPGYVNANPIEQKSGKITYKL